MSADALDRLADVLHRLVVAHRVARPRVRRYNLLLRTAPWVAGSDAWCHWRIELLPRVNAIAGLELATGIHINPLAPERAAESYAASRFGGESRRDACLLSAVFSATGVNFDDPVNSTARWHRTSRQCFAKVLRRSQFCR